MTMRPAVQFEESLLSARMAQLADDEDEEAGGEEGADGQGGEDFLVKDDGNDIDLR